jgi:hypothetical protein
MPQAANRKIDVRNIDQLEREDILRKLTYINDYLQNQKDVFWEEGKILSLNFSKSSYFFIKISVDIQKE